MNPYVRFFCSNFWGASPSSKWTKTEGLSVDVVFSVNKKASRSRAVEVDVSTVENGQVDNLPVFDFENETYAIPTLTITDAELTEMVNAFTATDAEDNGITADTTITHVAADSIVAGTLLQVLCTQLHMK